VSAIVDVLSANHSAAAQATLCVVEINHIAVATNAGSNDARTA
jgi:hypothetical protein